MKNGQTRMCIDYRGLNKLTIRDNYPLPLIEDCLEYLEGKKFFTKLDLKSGFHQVKVSKESIKYTAFVTPNGQYEYLRMPFGLKNAPAVFQRFINNIFRDFIDKRLIVIYMDDILLATESFEEHKCLLEKVLTRITKKELKLNLGKCEFGNEHMEALGYSVSASGIRPSDSHLAAIRNYPIPTTAKAVHSCLGLFSYFRRFVPQFSRIARPLQNMLRKDVKFDFNQNCLDAFVELKNRLMAVPVLAIYSPSKITELHTDASSLGFGAALLQKQEDGKFHPIAYFSKSTTDAESRYHSFELETLAIIYALQRFRVYLEGIPFKIITDCNSLAMTLERKHINRVSRWALELENYNYTIQHRSGSSMGHVDALSRCYDARESTTKGKSESIQQQQQNLDGRGRGEMIHEENIVAMVDNDDIDFRLQITQNRDPNITKIRSRLENGEMDNFRLVNDVLYYHNQKNGLNLLYVPVEMENNIIRATHEKIAHQSTDKCCDQIRMNYWFPNMRSKVDTFISNCIKCIMYATPVRSLNRNLYSIPKKPVPFDTLHFDHFGPLPTLISKRKYLLVVIDAFTKFVKLYPVNSTSTLEVKASLDKYFDYYGRPNRVITDRGSCFKSTEFVEYLKARNIVQIKVAVASPQANGQVERVNRVIKQMLGKLSEPISHADWTKKLQQVEYALNNTIHSTTKQTPSEMLFGVKQRGEIIDELTDYLEEKHELNRNLTEMRSKALESIERAQKYAEERTLIRNRPAKKYDVGDFIVILNVDTSVGSNKKFIPKYRGPYVVYKVLGHDRYVVRDIDNCQLTQLPYDGVIEAIRMRKWVSPLEPNEIERSTENHNTESGTEKDRITDDMEDNSSEIDDFEGFEEVDNRCEEMSSSEDFEGFDG